MPQEPGEQKRKLPERADALRIDLPFDEAVGAALKVKPPPKGPSRPKKTRKPT
jgi:hypothetical protein